MKILVTGYNGQLGYDVVREGVKRNLDIIGVTRNDFDITDGAAVEHYIKQENPEVIIHCAAYTAVDKAEDEQETCWEVNVEGTKNVARAAKVIGAKFVYISTDYVFDGEGETPFGESDPVNPIGYYGETKYNGERIVQELLDNYFIVRISWVFGINGNNFIKTMLRLAEDRDELNVVSDQFGSPTYTFDLAKLLLDMVGTDKYGIYHASNEGFCNWAQFAEEIFDQANKNVKVNAITTEEFPTKAKRPKNSRMSKDKLQKSGFARLPNWKTALSHYLNELEMEGN
ncbi:dTDP-4-dehydrorhamnose reductase [Gracilibacillus kekensis]|uniref:dTDP-4-dehydrorhamnose reductase n=1 Tax=Gracilibacillus kekensis TaxID=1027249 RepID=A0A1M7K105_9BACI|nr:dTDP-4-dehydrorhamnose reductase [Gracilibacillus kekensis]SHM58938.1 dTDP-4-dehydrorhamnose reductase [Gracilibacillus kekensis]